MPNPGRGFLCSLSEFFLGGEELGVDFFFLLLCRLKRQGGTENKVNPEMVLSHLYF